MITIDKQRVYEPSRTIVFRQEGRDGMLFDPATGDICTLNRTGVAIWKIMDGKRSIARIIDIITSRFPVPPRTAEKEIVAFVTELISSGLIRVVR